MPPAIYERIGTNLRCVSDSVKIVRDTVSIILDNMRAYEIDMAMVEGDFDAEWKKAHERQTE